MNYAQQSKEALRKTFNGDASWSGVNMLLDAADLPVGVMADAENLRFRTGKPTPRKGVVKLGWSNVANPVLNGVIAPFGTVYGVGTFLDPDSVEWVIVAADGLVYRCRENNAASSIPLPSGVKVFGPCKPVQAFNRVYLFRGRYLQPLVLSDFGTGFTDLLPRWDAVTVFNVAQEMAYGPFFTLAAGALVSSGQTATATTPAAHGYITGADVTVLGAVQAEYNGRFNVTVQDSLTFSYGFIGSVTTPATGTIKASNMSLYWKAIGTLWTLTALTWAASVATATKATHGFSNGQSVTIAGATPSGYNGTYVISNVTVNTFDYALAVNPGACTVLPTARNNTIVVAGQSPDSNPEAWQQIYNILPNADTALYANNQLLVPTAYTPGSTTFDATSSYTKKDFIVATDIQDPLHFQFANEFRINQGSPDELNELQKFGEDGVICLKGLSWGLLSNVRLDLSELRLDMLEMSYGSTALGASAAAGKDLYFLAERRGVIGVRQTEQSKVQSVDLPLSHEIQPLIERINWLYADKARLAYWDNKLYVAVPLDDAVCLTGELVRPQIYQIQHNLNPTEDPQNSVVFFSVPVVLGQTYYYKPGANEFELFNHGQLLTQRGRFVAAAGVAKVCGIGPGLPTTASVKHVLVGVNNCILVYDFLTGKWTPRDTGSALCVKEFFKAQYNGVARLFFVGEDGFVNLVEEADGGDQVQDSTQPTGLAWEEVVTRGLSRGYPLNDGRFGRPMEAVLGLASWNPNYSVRLIYDGVNESQYVNRDGVTVFTKDRTKYDRPFDAGAYDVTNTNDDHSKAYREDYSVPLGAAGLNLGSGVALDLMQDFVMDAAISPKLGRSVQIEVSNSTGKLMMKSIELTALRRRGRKGVLM